MSEKGERQSRWGISRDAIALNILSGIMSNSHRWADIERRYRIGELNYTQCNVANVSKAFSLADEFMRHSMKEQVK